MNCNALDYLFRNYQLLNAKRYLQLTKFAQLTKFEFNDAAVGIPKPVS
jgi:hypothetical protein